MSFFLSLRNLEQNGTNAFALSNVPSRYPTNTKPCSQETQYHPTLPHPHQCPHPHNNLRHHSTVPKRSLSTKHSTSLGMSQNLKSTRCACLMLLSFTQQTRSRLPSRTTTRFHHFGMRTMSSRFSTPLQTSSGPVLFSTCPKRMTPMFFIVRSLFTRFA